MKTFCFSIVMFVLTAFGSGCSSKITVENRRPPFSETTTEKPSTKDRSQRQETEQQETQAQSNPDQPMETQASTGQSRSYAVSQDNSSQNETAAEVPADGGNGETNPEDTATEEETATEGEGVTEEEVGIEADAGSPVEADAGTEPEPEPQPEPPPSDPHAFATEALGVLVRVASNTVVQPAEMPFWADDALATSAFERENGKIYTVLVYEKRPDELFEDWLVRSKVGGTRVSWRTVYARYGAVGYVYTADDYGAVPNVHIVVPSDRFVYYFRSEEETFHVPDDFVNFIRGVEVQ